MPSGAQLPLLPAASEWKLLDERERGTAFISIASRAVLNSPATTRMDFWSVNPYVGCEFGCTYCYARDTHRYAVERETARAETDGAESPLAGLVRLPPWLAFERRILVKRGAGITLAQTLDPARLEGSTLTIGTATDPYQPAERRFRITRGILEALTAYRGLSIHVITKSPLVLRDIDLFRRLTERGSLRVNISLITLDARLARRLETRSPVPSARIRALERLGAAGIPTGLFIAPVLPGITDGLDALDRLFAAARRAGAEYVMGSPLRLGPAARARFLPHLEREFPRLAARYRRHYARAVAAPAEYRRALADRVGALRARYGFPPGE
jgi:DNA repair photolyase